MSWKILITSSSSLLPWLLWFLTSSSSLSYSSRKLQISLLSCSFSRLNFLISFWPVTENNKKKTLIGIVILFFLSILSIPVRDSFLSSHHGISLRKTGDRSSDNEKDRSPNVPRPFYEGRAKSFRLTRSFPAGSESSLGSDVSLEKSGTPEAFNYLANRNRLGPYIRRYPLGLVDDDELKR